MDEFGGKFPIQSFLVPSESRVTNPNLRIVGSSNQLHLAL